MNLLFSIQLLISLSSLGLLLWDRGRLQARINVLSQHQTETDSSLNQFMQECERTLDELSRLCVGDSVPRPPEQGRFRHFAQTSSAHLTAVQTITGHDTAERGSQAAAKREGVGRKQQILRLARNGASISEIANQLRIPRAEVDLIVSLNQNMKVVGGRN
jgi:hypothetical protein